MTIAKFISALTLVSLMGFGLASCDTAKTPSEDRQEFKVTFDRITLGNGLTVLFHIDRSDPVVAVALTSHVGSARELPGRTGFAHLFEHLLFLESENLGKGGLDKMSARIGGSGANGSTSRDRTNYFQTVPKDALEKMIWAEADKLGFFINTVTEEVLAKEKQVVKNEKRQGVDNRPYGHTNYVIDKNLYPAGHPYNWQVIGSLEDLQNASLQDVKDFYNIWYTPNNVTLTIAGDFDVEQAKLWVHKYFDDIKRGPEVKPLAKLPVTLSENKSFYYEDNFARQAELRLVWPGVYSYHDDSYALDVLSQYLSQGKNAPLNKVLIDDQKLTSGVSMYSRNSELAGEIVIQLRSFDGIDLDVARAALAQAMADFEQNGISSKDLERIKAGQETAFYNSLSSVLGKGFQLAQYNIFAGDPAFINQDIKNILAVTQDDVMRVYETYLKGKHHISSSFVPKGQVELALENALEAEVSEEQIIQGAEEKFDASLAATYERTATTFDRTIEPNYGQAPVVETPDVWRDHLSGGMNVLGIENTELPLVQFSLTIDGGMLFDNPAKVGVASLLGDLMNAGTKGKSRAELEEAIESLGAFINVSAGRESITISGNTLAKNYQSVMMLVEEILLEPRFDKDEFDIAHRGTLSAIKQMQGQPTAIASLEFNKLLYGSDHIFSQSSSGTQESVSAITLDDLKAYYDKNLSPTLANFHIVGDIKQADVMASLARINERWKAKDISVPTYPLPKPHAKPTIYFYDVPGAKQSTFRFGHLALKRTDPDYYKASVMNYILGGGGFASRLTQELREGKGYTYGIYSGFSGTHIPGPFMIASNVRTNVTLQAAELVREIVADYSKSYSADDHSVMQNFMLKSPARAFETLSSKLNMLHNIRAYGMPADYVKQQQEVVSNMTLQEVQSLAEKYIRQDQMIYLIVGDAETQFEQLKKLGLENPIRLN